jgi:diaminopimelate decarboxylase
MAKNDQANEGDAPKAGESKADSFKRIAERRVNKALNAIAIIGGLASRTNYDYEPEQVAQIFKALENECNKLATRFKNPDSPKDGGFSFN